MREFLDSIKFLDDELKKTIMTHYEALHQRYLACVSQQTISDQDFIELKDLELCIHKIDAIIKSKYSIELKLIRVHRFLKKRWESPIAYLYPFITMNQFCLSLAKLIKLKINFNNDDNKKTTAYQIFIPTLKHVQNVVDEEEDIYP